MSVPSRKDQIDAVMRFLDSERNEGRSLEEIATDIVNGYHDFLMAKVKVPAVPLRIGMLIRTPLDSKVRRVAWMDDSLLWLVTDTAGVGWLGKETNRLWEYCEEYRPKRRIEVDGKGKMVEMTDEQIAEEWSNPDWKPGDRVSQHQREHMFEVLATGPLSVLLVGSDGRLTADSNPNMSKYYRREGKPAQW